MRRLAILTILLATAASADPPVIPVPAAPSRTQWTTYVKAMCQPPEGEPHECYVVSVVRDQTCVGDVTGDGQVDGADFIAMAEDWGCEEEQE